MIGWIKDRLKGAGHALADLWHAVHDVALTVWHVLARAASLVRHAWARFYRALRPFTHALRLLAERLYHATVGILAHFIPRAIRHAVRLLHKWASKLIGAVANLAKGLYRTLRDWASGAINAVKGFALDLWDWVSKHVGELATWVAKIGNKVADLVLHPAKLVAWLLPHLVTPLLEFLVAVGAKIGRWLLQQSVRAALATADVLESIIVKIL